MLIDVRNYAESDDGRLGIKSSDMDDRRSVLDAGLSSRSKRTASTTLSGESSDRLPLAYPSGTSLVLQNDIDVSLEGSRVLGIINPSLIIDSRWAFAVP